MKNITIIAAIGKNLELGKNNNLIWRFNEDMTFFKKNTLGKPIVMGLNTFYSLPKLLEGRKHLVLTHQNIDLGSNVIIMHSKDEVLKFVRDYKKEVMIIGGASIYSEFLDEAEKLVLTEIESEDKEADTYFPKFDKNMYESKLISEEVEKGIKYKHLVYKRRHHGR